MQLEQQINERSYFFFAGFFVLVLIGFWFTYFTSGWLSYGGFDFSSPEYLGLEIAQAMESFPICLTCGFDVPFFRFEFLQI